MMDFEGDSGLPVVISKSVDTTDALVAAAAILAPALAMRPDLGCRTLGSLVAMADPTVCDDCARAGDCELAQGDPGPVVGEMN